jgi:TetR/AcrR family transcriptional regulator, transcriptional repressor for nem operon
MSTIAGKRRQGRPAQFDRGCALGDLLSLFWRKGYEAATQEEMLAATGLSSSSLYRSFGTKADILEAVLQLYVANADTMLAALEHGRAGIADVHTFLEHVDALIDGPMGTCGCLVVETMRNPINEDPRIKNLTDRHLKRMHEGLASALQRAAAAGEIPSSTADTLVDALQAGVIGVLATARAGDTRHAIKLLRGVRALLPEH